MRLLKLCGSLAFAAMLAGCAHSIIITPDPAKLQLSAGETQSNQSVGYYIADDLRNKEVITPGGGGDKVSYQPYRDLETSLYKVLSNLYASVTKLKTPTDPAIANNHLTYVITPTITTNSSSSSLLTWPPTDFTVDLTCKISDPAGNVVSTKSVTGTGNAEFKEFVHDHGLAAKRATENAMLKLQQELAGMSGSNYGTAAAPVSAPVPVAAAVVATSTIESAPQPALVRTQKVATPTAPTAPVTPAEPVAPVTPAAPAAPQQQYAAPYSPSEVRRPAAPAAVTPTPAAPAPAAPVQTYTVPDNNNVADTSATQVHPAAVVVGQTSSTGDFPLGVSSNTVERMARQSGCESKQGAALISTAGPVENYRMACTDGKVFVAHCEYRQCSTIEFQ